MRQACSPKIHGFDFVFQQPFQQFNRRISLQITFIAIPCAIELSRSSFVHNSAQP